MPLPPARAEWERQMPEDPTARWLRFELVTFSAPTGIPHGWDAELLNKGVPKSLLGRYRARSELVLVEVPDYGPLVCFGTTMVTNSVCLDPRTGAIVETDYVPTVIRDPSRGGYGLPGFVNSSLGQFIASVRAVLNRFPFNSTDTGADRELDERTRERARAEQREGEWNHAVEDLTEILRQIDPAAVADEYTFWRTFVDDVQMGNFATEGILRLLDQ
jgi:SUKH-4 immunity protein